MRFFSRLGIFFQLKWFEISNWFGRVDWSVFTIPLIIYGLCYLISIGSYIGEKNYGLTWQYTIINAGKDVNDVNDDIFKMTSNKDETSLKDIGIVATSLVLVVGIPLIGAVILMSWGLLPLMALFVVFLLCIPIWLFFKWLYGNWVTAGKIVDGVEKKPWKRGGRR